MEKVGIGWMEKHKSRHSNCRINRQSFVPFYQQIKNYLLDRIRLGQLSNGDLIPSETQLSGALSVSRGTVRQALYELRVEGYVVREKGRGTFVKRPLPKRFGNRTDPCVKDRSCPAAPTPSRVAGRSEMVQSSSQHTRCKRSAVYGDRPSHSGLQIDPAPPQ